MRIEKLRMYFFVWALFIMPCIPHMLCAQQKVQFSQYMFNYLVINPAYAGADEALSLTFINRSQWNGIENAPKTQTLSGHTLFKKKSIGLGMTIVNDRIGVHKNLSILTDYAYRIPMGENSSLSMGLQAGINNMQSDYASLTGSGVNDPKLTGINISEVFFEVGAGIYYRSPKFQIGFSAPELIPDNIFINDSIQIQNSNTNYFLFSSYKIGLSENLVMEPSVLLKYFPGLPFSFDVNLNFIYRDILTLGLSYRKSESIDFLLIARISNQLKLGYAYDYTIGEVSRYSTGSHELMIQYMFKYVKSNIASPRQ